MDIKALVSYCEAAHGMAVDSILHNPQFLQAYEKFGLPIYDKAQLPKMITKVEHLTVDEFTARSSIELMYGTLTLYSGATSGWRRANNDYRIRVDATVRYYHGLGFYKYADATHGNSTNRHSAMNGDLSVIITPEDEAKLKKEITKTYAGVVNRIVPSLKQFDYYMNDVRRQHIKDTRKAMLLAGLFIQQNQLGETKLTESTPQMAHHFDRLKTIMREYDTILKELNLMKSDDEDDDNDDND